LDQQSVAAIAVVDLARILMRLQVLTAQQVEAVCDASVLADARALATGQDISHRMMQRLPETMLIGLWQHAAVHGSSRLGWQIGQDINPAAQGMLAHWIRHSQTLKQAFFTYRDNIALLNASEGWQVDDSGDDYRMTFHYPALKGYPDIAVQRSLVSIKTWGEFFSGRSLQLQSVSLCQSASQADQAFVAALFQCPVYFSQDSNRLILSNEQASAPLPQANDFMAQMLARQAAEIPLQDGDIVQQVEALFGRSLAEFSAIESVCQALNTSRSTLFRQLKAQGTSFSQLLDQFRHRLWLQHTQQFKTQQLQTWQPETQQRQKQSPQKQLPQKQPPQSSSPRQENSAFLTELLGFSDPSSFYKARKRWLDQ